MDRGVDVLGMLRWGLSKYAWVVLVLAAAAGTLLPLAQSQRVDVYEARALVGLQGEPVVQNLDVYPKTGEDIFANGAVARETRKILDLSDTTAVIPQRVELVAQQDALTFPVLARDDDPKRAQRVANTAAAIFALQMSSTQTGEFVVQSEAELPVTPLPGFAGGTSAIVIATLAGALAGVGVIAMLLIWRRPVLDPDGAEEATGVPVLGRVRLPRGSGPVDLQAAAGITAVARRLLTGRSSLVLLASADKTAPQRRALLLLLRNVLGETRDVRVLQSDGVESNVHNGASTRRRGRVATGARQPEMILVDDPRSAEQAARPDESMLLLVVPEGVSLASLRHAAEEHLDGGAAGLVLVYQSRRMSRRRRTGSGVDRSAAVTTHSTDRDPSRDSLVDDDDDDDEHGHLVDAARALTVPARSGFVVSVRRQIRHVVAAAAVGGGGPRRCLLDGADLSDAARVSQSR